MSQADFLIEKDYRSYYALAYVEKADLRANYLEKGRDVLEKINAYYKQARSYEQSGDVGPAMEIYVSMLPLFPEIMEYRTIYNIVTPVSNSRENDTKGTGTKGFFASLGDEIGSTAEVTDLENTVRTKLRELEKSGTPDLDTASEKIAAIVQQQEVKGGRLKVPALLYEYTDFSSAFGSYAARKMESFLNGMLPSGGTETVIRGTYWDREGNIEMFVVAQEVNSGEKIGAAYAAFPASAVPEGYDIKPQNFRQAMEDRRQFAEGAITDGGITVEV